MNTREARLKDEIRKWFLDPKNDFMHPYMIRFDKGRIINVHLKPKNNTSHSTSSLTVCKRTTEFHIMAKGILKSAREEDGGVVLLPLYQGDNLEIQGKRAGNYNDQPMTTLHVPLYENTWEVRRILKTLLQALA
jgi:hypothetical protein